MEPEILFEAKGEKFEFDSQLRNLGAVGFNCNGYTIDSISIIRL